MSKIDKMAFKLLDAANQVIESEEELLIYKHFLRTASNAEIVQEYISCGFDVNDLDDFTKQ